MTLQREFLEVSVGHTVIVLAWWNAGRPVRCRLDEVYSTSDNCLVKPLEGNPHSRMIKFKDITEVTQ